MEDEQFLGSITFRVGLDTLKHLEKVSGKTKNFRDRSEAIRHYIDLGRRVECIMELKKDPVKKKEFDEKFSHLMGQNNFQEIADTMNEVELDSAIFYLQNTKSKKIQQLIDNVKRS